METKYFISYVAYTKSGYDFFNDIIYLGEDITNKLLEEIQSSLVNKLNNNTENKPYYTTQIIFINKI
jgi:hypothetical protein